MDRSVMKRFAVAAVLLTAGACDDGSETLPTRSPGEPALVLPDGTELSCFTLESSDEEPDARATRSGRCEAVDDQGFRLDNDCVVCRWECWGYPFYCEFTCRCEMDPGPPPGPPMDPPWPMDPAP